MKKYLIVLLLLFTTQQLFATTTFDLLCKFNPNWKKYEGRIRFQVAQHFTSDKEYVAVHLYNVLVILKSNPVSDLDAKQYSARLRCLELLDRYRLAKNFPVNYYINKRVPVFIDEHDTHCAVGYLLQQTGNEDIALRISSTNNYAWVKDISDKGLLEWQKRSGLSIEELKLIQGAYDFYMPGAFFLPNKYEVPQKPDCIKAYFVKDRKKAKKYIWCYGEGKDGILNGIWTQNYAAGIPWIVGYFKNGKRTGQWKEYYQGTKILCRTESWKDDKLNGVRIRFDRSGNIIEKIAFKNGVAITKTNFDLEQGLVWKRVPLEDNLVFTEVLSTTGKLIASGHETIYNPGNLQWFQNIELTALNAAAITSRNIFSKKSQKKIPLFTKPALYNTTPLVQYQKEGNWVYYKDLRNDEQWANNLETVREQLYNNYIHFEKQILNDIGPLNTVRGHPHFDSVRIVYSAGVPKDCFAYSGPIETRLLVKDKVESVVVFSGTH